MYLVVYGRKCYKEFSLDTSRNKINEFTLNATEWGFSTPVVLSTFHSDSGLAIELVKGGKCVALGCAERSFVPKMETPYSCVASNGDSFAIIVSDNYNILPVFDKYILPTDRVLSIGSESTNTICYKFENAIEKKCAEMRYSSSSGGFVLHCMDKCIVYLNGERVRDTVRIHFGDVISVFGLKIVYAGTIIGIKALVGTYIADLSMKKYDVSANSFGQKRLEQSYSDYKQSARILPRLYDGVVEIDQPPAPENVKKKSVFATIGRSLTMSIPMLLGCAFMMYARSSSSGGFMSIGAITAVTSALIGAVWALISLNSEKIEQREHEEKRFNSYGNYLLTKANELSVKYEENYKALTMMYPSPEVCLSYTRSSPELWNRNPSHKDFLFVRLGLGTVPFQIEVKTPKQGYTQNSDKLRDFIFILRDDYSEMENVPVGIDFRTRPLVGIAGYRNPANGADYGRELVKSIIAQIITNISYHDVKIVLINNSDDGFWHFMKDVPHCYSGDKAFRYISFSKNSAGEVGSELASIIRERKSSQQRKSSVLPHYIVIATEPSVLEHNMLASFLLHPEESYGVSTIILSSGIATLPNECEYIIDCDRNICHMGEMLNTGGERYDIIPDFCSTSALRNSARNMANIRIEEKNEDRSIPSSVTFLGMYKAGSVQELNISSRWRKNNIIESIAVPIGLKAGSALCDLDIHEKMHGPHGLVAGTTGSGKSELLQTYILSLCVNFSPDDINFLIIDYKGGGMSGLFEGLPHLAGSITNLGGNSIRRALLSVKSEIRRRQVIFARYYVKKIDEYTALYKSGTTNFPLPHLIIIVDEFAELKKNESEFMRELISVAQVGRSLGIHLILATQKPSGTVDDNIRSNAKFSLCLRVQDIQDSKDMLAKPDAAYITNPGGCIMRVGTDEIYEPLQSAWSGAPLPGNAENNERVAKLLTDTGHTLINSTYQNNGGDDASELFDRGFKDAVKVKLETQLDAVIGEIARTFNKDGYLPVYPLWLPEIGHILSLEELRQEEKKYGNPNENSFLGVTVGLADDPANQTRGILKVDFAAGGNHLVLGTVATGKSTFILTTLYCLIEKYSPREVNFYIADFSSGALSVFGSVPHVGGYVTENDGDKIKKLFFLINNIITERRAKLHGGTWSDYNRHNPGELPAVIFVIDNYAVFRDKTELAYDRDVMRISREGLSLGVFFFISAAGFGINEVNSRLAENFRTTITLELTDKFKYVDALHTTKIGILPESGVAGRGLARFQDSCLEFQTALVSTEADEYSRLEKIKSMLAGISSKYSGMSARPVPEIPKKPTVFGMKALSEYPSLRDNPASLVFGYDSETAALSGIALDKSYCNMIVSPDCVGYASIIRLLAEFAAHKPQAQVAVISNTASEYKYPELVRVLHSYDEIFDYFKNLMPVFIERNKQKKSLIDAGEEDDAIFSRMAEYPPVFIFIEDLNAFFDLVYHPSPEAGHMEGFLENIFDKGNLHNIYFFGGITASDNVKVSLYKAFRSFSKNKNGILAGMPVSSQKLINFGNMPFAESSRAVPAGAVLTATPNEDDVEMHRLFIPRDYR